MISSLVKNQKSEEMFRDCLAMTSYFDYFLTSSETHHREKSVYSSYSLLWWNIWHILRYQLVCYSFWIRFTKFYNSLFQIYSIHGFLFDDNVCDRHLDFSALGLVARRCCGLVTERKPCGANPPKWRITCTCTLIKFKLIPHMAWRTNFYLSFQRPKKHFC